MPKISYKKCPRCELNYIDSRKDMCEICKIELNMPSDLLEEEEDVEKELCPICKIHYISLDEEMCEACATEKNDVDVTAESDSWRNFVDEEQDPSLQEEELEIPLEELQDEEFGESYDDEEEEETYHHDDDFPDDFEDLEDIDFDDDDDDDDDESDDDD